MQVYRVTAERKDVWSILVLADSPNDAIQKVNANYFDNYNAECVDQGEWVAKTSEIEE